MAMLPGMEAAHMRPAAFPAVSLAYITTTRALSIGFLCLLDAEAFHHFRTGSLWLVVPWVCNPCLWRQRQGCEFEGSLAKPVCETFLNSQGLNCSSEAGRILAMYNCKKEVQSLSWEEKESGLDYTIINIFHITARCV